MARPVKNGIDYFPLDVDFFRDIKIRKILKSHGPSSISILINLLCNIYRDEGYYMRWDDDTAFLVADEVGTKEESVKEVVNKSIQVDLFNEKMFKKHQILTSKGIQERYLKATERRVNANINYIYSLRDVDIMRTETELMDTETEVNVCKSTQSKGK